jgi:hydroxymethylpyrimidine pyrophosphatase-like HAD family hydrolase
MFSHARISIAVSNAHEELKKKATVIAPSNDKEGVACALKEFGIVS